MKSSTTKSTIDIYVRNKRMNSARIRVEILQEWPGDRKPTLSTYPANLKCIQHPYLLLI